MTEAIKIGQRFRNREPLDVFCWWWYDMAAILDDYSDHCSARLPSGEEFTVMEIPEGEPTRVLCDLKRANELKAKLIPKGRQINSWYCLSTPYRVEIDATHILTRCDQLETSGNT